MNIIKKTKDIVYKNKLTSTFLAIFTLLNINGGESFSKNIIFQTEKTNDEIKNILAKDNNENKTTTDDSKNYVITNKDLTDNINQSPEDSLHQKILNTNCQELIKQYGQIEGIKLIRKHLLIEINNVREQNGLSKLTENPILSKTAQGYARYMFENDWYSHTSKQGENFSQRFKKAGYNASVGVENINKTFFNTQTCINNRLDSKKGHRENLLHPYINDIGVGYYGGLMEISNGIFLRYDFFVMDAAAK